MKVVVVGAGYVGLVTGICLAEFGHDVTMVDANPARVESLKSGQCPIYEPGLTELLHRNLETGRLHVAQKTELVVANSDVIFLAVSTPASGSGQADLTYIQQATQDIISGLALSNRHHTVVIKSTVPVGTGASIQSQFDAAGLNPQVVVVSNPEFLREGSAVQDCLNPDRIVIGAAHPDHAATLKALYHPYVARDIRIMVVSQYAAEHIKYAANAFLALKISFINELGHLCEKTHTDVQEVATGIGLDHRINPYFLNVGPGFGGSCFPKDVAALQAVGQAYDVPMALLDAVLLVNTRQKQHVVSLVRRAAPVPAPRVAVLGLAFKGNTDDMRDAPALDIVPALVADGCTVVAFDPVAQSNASGVLPKSIHYAASVAEAVTDADLVLILTEWNAFYDLDWAVLKGLVRHPVVVDTRRVVDPVLAQSAGFRYIGIGRG